jgi:hypothetical protein
MTSVRLACVLVVLAACPARPREEVARSSSRPHLAMQSGKPTSGAAVHAAATLPAAPASCIDDGEPFDQAALRDRLAVLASKDLAGRVPGSAGDSAARTLIAERFGCLGLTPAGDDDGFEQAFAAAGGAQTANVVGYVAGSDAEVGNEIIVIGAHHDHIGGKLLGANDNASGVVALLAIAQAVKQRDSAPRRTIAFVTFGAEEQGLLGSEHFVAHPPAALPIDKVVQLINLDMVGSHKSKGFVAAMGTFPKQPSRKLLDALDDGFPKLNVGAGGRASRSDHTPFCKRGIPYVFFWTPDARCYHEACDVAAAIDLPRMADIAALAGELAWALAEADQDLQASRTKLGCGA